MKRWTIAHIAHDEEVLNKYLRPSINRLTENIDVLSISSVEMFPAKAYNLLVKNCKTPYIILTHEDVSFSADLIQRIEITMEAVPDFGALGFAGPDHWSECKKIHEVDTLDSCFVVIRTNNRIRFDEDLFGEYHMYVEDYCAQLNRIYHKGIYTIMTQAMTTDAFDDSMPSYLNHHGITARKTGFCWGNYWHYRQLLETKWPKIKTT